jgi:hypothetical protein
VPKVQRIQENSQTGSREADKEKGSCMKMKPGERKLAIAVIKVLRLDKIAGMTIEECVEAIEGLDPKMGPGTQINCPHCHGSIEVGHLTNKSKGKGNTQ